MVSLALPMNSGMAKCGALSGNCQMSIQSEKYAPYRAQYLHKG